MPRYTAQCGYYAHWHITVDVEADDLESACAAAIAEANQRDAWRSGDDVTETYVDAIAEGDDTCPWGPDALPVPLRFTHEGEPPHVILSPAGGDGSIETVHGRLIVSFVSPDGTVTAERPPRALPARPKPLVTVRRRPEDGRPHVTVTGGDARVRILD